MEKAPITAAQRKQLERDAANLKACAQRKGTTLDAWDERREGAAAREFFTLGCWLFYYSRRIYQEGVDGFKARVDCARRLFLAGIFSPGYRFFTVFDFGERQFDTIFEMGDAEQVIDELRKLIPTDETGKLSEAFANFGWPIEKTKRIFVCAWDSEGSGGFDWFYEEKPADEAFEREKANCHELAASGWTAYRFHVDIPAGASPDEITSIIDGDLRHHCDTSATKYRVAQHACQA